MSSKQSKYEERTRRALRVIRKLAKDNDFRVGGHGGTQVDEFMDAIESGKLILVKAHIVNLQPNKDCYEQSESSDKPDSG